VVNDDGSAGREGDALTGPGEKLERLAAVMAKLRSPEGGCPWDLEQTAESLSRHMLEEAYEAVEAIDSSDWLHLEEELGDLLLQIVFQSRIAEECGRFELGGVVDGIVEKLERRHPHIFGEVEVDSAQQVSINWDRIKREEEGLEFSGALKVPIGLPAVMAALKIQGQAARAGFDWAGADEVFPKLEEEIRELWDARNSAGSERENEIGDLLFTVINVSRHLGVDPERALRRTCEEFVNRYSRMEEEAGGMGVELSALPMAAKDELWEKAKLEGRGESGVEED
jgi:MazG family protein